MPLSIEQRLPVNYMQGPFPDEASQMWAAMQVGSPLEELPPAMKRSTERPFKEKLTNFLKIPFLASIRKLLHLK